jgi:hypothetical protein
MKNEREKEIEHVKPFNRYNGGCFKQRDKARQQITKQQNVNISISWPQKNRKAKGEVYVVNIKRRRQRRKNGIRRIK